VGAERAIEFCEQNWLTLSLLALAAFAVLAIGPALIRQLSRRVPKLWTAAPPSAVLYVKAVLSLVLVFFVFGWLPLNVARVQAAINIEKFDYLFSQCATGEGDCTLYRTATEVIPGIRLTGDRDRVFVVVGHRQTRILSTEQIISVGVGRPEAR
jgi:hypothetical protein